jgi:phosphatidylserine/phosphatidylglycerophosphate/cardiolipin synthase-like enzyme
MINRHLIFLAIALPAMAFTSSVDARKKSESLVDSVVSAYETHHSFTMPASGTIEVAFSPNEGSEALVIKVIDSARSELRLLSYSFTSAPVTSALLRAVKRGVDVRLVADRKNNISADSSGKARAALSALANAGIDVRTIGAYAIHHDKVIIADRQTVELGSFNYSAAAASQNSENVLVNWGNANLAQVYLAHFERNYRQATPYELRY